MPAERSRQRRLMTLRRVARAMSVWLVLFILPPGCMMAAHYSGQPTPRGYGSIGLAPPADTPDAVIQVYAARAARWRGAIGVHTWFATKRTTETGYTRLEVIGYRVYWGGGAVRVRQGTPDAIWFGNRPTLLREIRGSQEVDEIIDRLHAAARDYPHNDVYHVWPGPNSNTFTAHLARGVPELRLELPVNAVGKDWLSPPTVAAKTPSGTGVQLSLAGYAGVLIGLEEGIEINLLGLSAGFDLLPPAIKLPGVGRLGFPDLRRLDYRPTTHAEPSPRLPPQDERDAGALNTPGRDKTDAKTS